MVNGSMVKGGLSCLGVRISILSSEPCWSIGCLWNPLRYTVQSKHVTGEGMCVVLPCATATGFI